MKFSFKILLLIALLSSGCQLMFSQTSDSTHVVRKNDKSVNEKRNREVDRNQLSDDDHDKTNPGNNNKQKNPALNNQEAFKRINGARPDLSRMRGARPPDIVRPSGSLIPRGVGRPGGMPRPGGR